MFRIHRLAIPALALGGALTLAAIPAAHANLVTNGDFSGQLGNWTVSGNGITADNSIPNGTDSYDAQFSIGPSGTLSQMLGTVAGINYLLTLSLIDTNSFFSNTSDAFQINLGGFSTTVTGDQAQGDPGAYRDFSFNVLGSQLSGNDTLSFQATALDNSFTYTWNLDDVSLTQQQPATVPEPAAWAVMGAGVLVLLGLRRRQARRA